MGAAQGVVARSATHGADARVGVRRTLRDKPTSGGGPLSERGRKIGPGVRRAGRSKFGRKTGPPQGSDLSAQSAHHMMRRGRSWRSRSTAGPGAGYSRSTRMSWCRRLWRTVCSSTRARGGKSAASSDLAQADIAATLVPSDPKLAKFGRARLEFGKSRAHTCPTRARCAPALSEFDRSRPQFGQSPAKPGPDFDRSMEGGRLRLNGRRRARTDSGTRSMPARPSAEPA